MGRKDVARVTDSPLRPTDAGLPLARGGFVISLSFLLGDLFLLLFYFSPLILLIF
jgi:hypothetical protein